MKENLFPLSIGISVLVLLISISIACYFKIYNFIVWFIILMFFMSLLVLLVWYAYNKYENPKNEILDWYFPIRYTSIGLFITFGIFIALYLMYPQGINIVSNAMSNVSYPYFADNSSIQPTFIMNLKDDAILSYLETIASTLVAINSIIISITLLIIQHVSDKRGTILMDLFFKDKYFWGFIGTTVITVLLMIIAILVIPHNTVILVLSETLAWDLKNVSLTILRLSSYR